jgi:TatD DNase family protein
MATFFDTHAHLDGPSFAADLPQVITRASEAGIVKLITIGTDLESSRRAIALAEEYPNVYAVVGWHPSDAHLAPPDWRPQLRDLANHPKVVALGETGLDYYRLPSKTEGGSPQQDQAIKIRQAELFRQHLEVAAELGLNCVIHQRDSMGDTIAQLEPFAPRVKGVFHCFAGPGSALQRILDMGSLVSYTGILTFKNGENVRQALAATPMGKFMLETDSPYLAPIPYRGKRCEPAYVKETSSVAAEVKKCTLQELSAATCSTAEEFFSGLGPDGR